MGSLPILLSTFDFIEKFMKELEDIGYVKCGGISFSADPETTNNILLNFINSLIILSHKLINSIDLLKESSGLLLQTISPLEEKELNMGQSSHSFNPSSSAVIPNPKDFIINSSSSSSNISYDTISDEFLATASCIGASTQSRSNGYVIKSHQNLLEQPDSFVYSINQSDVVNYSAKKSSLLASNIEVIHNNDGSPIESYKPNVECKISSYFDTSSGQLSTVKNEDVSVENSIVYCIKCCKKIQFTGLSAPNSFCNQCKSLPECPEIRKKRSRPGDGHTCTDCGRKFRMWKHWSLHMKKVHKDAQGKNIVSIANHSSDVSLPVFCCVTCHIACPNLQIFNEHVCRLPEDTESNNMLSNRILIQDISKLELVQKFVCSTCNIEFRSLARTIYHLPRCLPGPYNCNFCTQIFKNLRDLNYHKNKNHVGEKCFSCDECGKSFQCKASLRKHSILKHESKDGVKELSSKLGPFKCELCPKKFIKKIFLTNHKIRMHALNKKFLCQVCGNRFLTKSSLCVHMEIHKEHRRFECSHCSKRFRAKEKLQHHERIHTGERPFLCDRCSKAFVSKSRLNEHISRHNGEKRYCCQDCNKSYSAAWDLKQHIKKIHRKEPSSIPVMVIPSNITSVSKNVKQYEAEDQSTIQQAACFSNISVAPTNTITIPIHGLPMGHLFQVSQLSGTDATMPAVPMIEHDYSLIGRPSQETLQTFELSLLQQHPSSRIYN